MHYVSNFSGGLCSFWASHRTVQRHGPLNVTLLFADTLIEDEELYEFNAQASTILGVPITRISLELSPWQLFRREKMIANNQFPICSTKLKREVLDAWMSEHFQMNRHEIDAFLPNAALVVGFEWLEMHRVVAMREAHPNWQIEAPMQEGEIWDKCQMETEARKLGLKIPKLYTLGFPHNNCGGRCVRAGISHWVHLLDVLPGRFHEWENEEWETAEYLRSLDIEPLSILKDRRGGETKNLYLRDLRLRVESGEKFDRYDWGGCGCGGATSSTAPAHEGPARQP